MAYVFLYGFFDGFAEQIVAKFVNASTVDGHNPYRIGRGGTGLE